MNEKTQSPDTGEHPGMGGSRPGKGESAAHDRHDETRRDSETGSHDTPHRTHDSDRTRGPSGQERQSRDEWKDPKGGSR